MDPHAALAALHSAALVDLFSIDIVRYRRTPRRSGTRMKAARGRAKWCCALDCPLKGYRPASANMACSNTLVPAARSAGFACSASLWLRPPSQGTKTMPVGATWEM